MSARSQMGYVEQPQATYAQQQQQQDAGGGVVPVSVNGVPGVMPVGMPVQQQQQPQQQGGGVQQQQQGGGAPAPVAMTSITRVYVGNLSWETEWQDLKDHMRTAGEVSI